MIISTLLIALLSSVAQAVPPTLTHQGRLLDAAGQPLEQSHPLRFAIYANVDDVDPLWTETIDASFVNGYFSVILGESTSLDPAILPPQGGFLGLSVDGADELLDRVALTAVPYALSAFGVEGGVVNASKLLVNGVTVVDAAGQLQVHGTWSDVVDVPGALRSLGDLTCAEGQLASQTVSGTWSCVDPNAHAHSASQLTSGLIGPDRLPFGTGPSTVAEGDHVHTFDVIQGSLSAGQVASLSPSDIGAAPTQHSHGMADLTGPIDATTLNHRPVSDFALMTHGHNLIGTGVVPANGQLNITHNAGTEDIALTLWTRRSGRWALANFSAPNVAQRAVFWAGFDERTGTSSVDTSGNGNTLTLNGAASWSTGRIGGGTNLLDATSFWTAPNSPSLDLSGTALSLTAWVNPSSTCPNECQILNKESAYEWALFSNGNVQWAIETSEQLGWFWVDTGYTVPLNQWTHLTLVYDGADVIVYANGVEVSRTAQIGTLMPSAQVLTVGARPGSSAFRVGQLDEVGVFDRALQPKEVNQLFVGTRRITVEQADVNTLTVYNEGYSDATIKVVVTP